jgi:hypothetical protein
MMAIDGARHSDYSGESDGELLRCAATDPGAFGALYERHIDAVLAFLYARTASPEMAADLASETFLAPGDPHPGRRRLRRAKSAPRARLTRLRQRGIGDLPLAWLVRACACCVTRRVSKRCGSPKEVSVHSSASLRPTPTCCAAFPRRNGFSCGVSRSRSEPWSEEPASWATTMGRSAS